MNVPTWGYLRLHFQKDPIVGFFPLLQRGFYVARGTGNLLGILCRICRMDAEQVRDRIQTLFLNGKPVDDMERTDVNDGDCLALSAAMPGLVGATMRSGGVLAGFRRSISHQAGESPTGESSGIIMIKLFNLLIAEMGPRFLQKGILIGPDDLRSLMEPSTQIQWGDCREAELNSRPIEIDALKTMELDPGKGFIRFEVTSG